MNINKFPEEKQRQLQHIILDDINKLVSSGISINEKKTGAYFVLLRHLPKYHQKQLMKCRLSAELNFFVFYECYARND